MEYKKFIKNRKGIFGLDSVKAFFTVLLGLALLTFVIIVIMGTLEDSNVGGRETISGSLTNKSFNLNITGFRVFELRNLNSPSMSSIFIINASNALVLVEDTDYRIDIDS